MDQPSAHPPSSPHIAPASPKRITFRRTLWLHLRTPLLYAGMILVGAAVFIAEGICSQSRRPYASADVPTAPPETLTYDVPSLPKVRVQGIASYVRRGEIAATPADNSSNVRYIDRVLVPEASKYPRTFLQNIGVGQILLCSHLTLYGRAIAGTKDSSGTLYIEIPTGQLDTQAAAGIFHHELYHFVDQKAGKIENDPEWTKLNPPDFHYGVGGWLAIGNPEFTTNLRDDLPCFVSGYSKSAPAEDKAEIFSVLMINPAFLARRTATDNVLSLKVRLLCARFEELSPGALSASRLRQAGIAMRDGI